MSASRREFSDFVMAEASRLGQTAESFAEATGVPLETVLSRAKAAGIEMRREEPKFMIGMNVPELIAERKQ